MSNLTVTCGSDFSTNEVLMSGVVIGLASLLGLFCNCLNLLAFVHKSQRHLALNWYLISLSIADLIALCSSIFMISLPIVAEKSGYQGFQDLINYCAILAYPVGMIAQTASVYFTVSAAAHRFVGVAYPFASEHWCCSRNVRLVIGTVCGASVIYNITRFFEFSVQECHRNNTSINSNNGTLIKPTELRASYGYQTIYFLWMYTFIMLVLPFIMLIGMNVRVIFEVHKSRKRHHMPLSTSDTDIISKYEAQKERSTTIMLISVSVAFLAFNALALASNVMELLDMRDRVYTEIVAISNLLVILNMSSHTLIYYVFSHKFRNAVAIVLHRRKTILDNNNEMN